MYDRSQGSEPQLRENEAARGGIELVRTAAMSSCSHLLWRSQLGVAMLIG